MATSKKATELILNPSWREMAILMKDSSITLGLAGPPGIGKTSFGFEIAKFLKKPVFKIQFHNEMSPSEVMGMHVPGEGRFMWEPGPGDRAYSEGGLLLLDEINEASGPTKTYCYALLDRGPGGTVSYVGRKFEQKKGYQPFATMNGDPMDGSLPDALLDRFDAWFIVTKPSDNLIKMLELDLQDVCRALYDSAADPMVGPSFTFRMLMAMQKLRKVLNIEQAVLGACKGNQKLAAAFMEQYVLAGDDIEEADNDYEEDDD